MKKTQQGTDYTQMGIAATMPGLLVAIKHLQAEYDRLVAFLATAQGFEPLEDTARVYLDEPKPKPKELKSGWPSDPEERKAEMRRRMAKHAENALGPISNHPRDPRHPGHEQWLKNLRKAQKKAWGKLSDAQKKAKVDSLYQARHRMLGRDKKPAAKLERAS